MYIYTLPMIHIDYMADETLKAGISGSGEISNLSLESWNWAYYIISGRRKLNADKTLDLDIFHTIDDTYVSHWLHDLG